MTSDDGTPQEGAAGARPSRRTRTGPRPAAPRKPLLTRLHVPAGKVMALAAMPTVVLMSMGLTPQLAGAKPLPKNPFRDGPCVSAPDQETDGKPGEEAPNAGGARDGESASVRPRTPGAPEPGPTVPGEPPTGIGAGRTPDAGSAARPGATPEAPPEAPSEAGPATGADRGAPEPEPSDSGRTTARNPLDPLGVGDALRDLLTPDGRETAEERQTGEQQRTAEDPGASPSASPSPSPTGGDRSGGLVKDIAERAGQSGEKTGEAIPGTGPEATATPEITAPEATVPGPESSGKEPYPCPTHDAEALANAEHEATEAVLPNAPWQLESSLLALHGLKYHGIVKVRTHDGTVKDVLKFTAASVDIRDLHQLVDGPGSTTAHVEAGRGSTSTIRDGTVTMYTEELKGNLFGIIPVVFSPKSPPPLTPPEVFFTEATVRQAGQFGGTLHIPGMHLYNER